jgi:hypothetical protein
VLVPGRPFQSSIMFAGKATILPQSGAPEKCFTRVGSSLARQHLIRLERPTRVKHSSVIGPFENYGRKKFYNTSLCGQCYKTFYCRKLRLFIISFHNKHFSGAPLSCRLLASPTNIRLGLKGLPWTNTLAYYEES